MSQYLKYNYITTIMVYSTCAICYMPMCPAEYVHVCAISACQCVCAYMSSMLFIIIITENSGASMSCLVFHKK